MTDIAKFVYINYTVLYTAIILFLFLVTNRVLDRKVKDLFYLVVGTVVLDAVSYSAELYYAGLSEPTMQRVLSSAAGYIARPAILYFIVLIMTRNVQNNSLKLYFGLPLFADSVIIAILAPTTKLLFYYDENNVYHPGPFSFFTYGLLIVYVILALVIAIKQRRKHHTEILLIVISALFILFNLVYELGFYSGINVRETTIALGVLSYFMFFQTQNHRREIMDKEMTLLEKEHKMTTQMLDETLAMLAYTIDAKDAYTKGHSTRVAEYTERIAELAGLSESECRQAYYSGLVHDIGKINIPDMIINKPGSLSEEEYDLIKKHPVDGAAILAHMGGMLYLQAGAHYHHERYDGHGYPEGLKGEQIPVIARIIAVADAYDAMTSKRSYRDPLPQSVVKEEIKSGIGSQFDPVFAGYMLKLIEEDSEYRLRAIEGADEIDKMSIYFTK